VAEKSIVCFGEILWDCLPRGLFLGGAPVNAACHLAQLGFPAKIISAVGDDFLGEEALRRIAGQGVDVSLTTRRADYPTGTVSASLDDAGNASYSFPAPVAWDAIDVSEAALAAAKSADAIVFGSLAQRSPSNLEGLMKLLEFAGPRRFFDVNLRPPHDDLGLVRELAQRADVVKLNESELARLVEGSPTNQRRELDRQCAALADRVRVDEICVTLGASGACYWRNGDMLMATAPAVEVRDTVGAGDAFMAALVARLVSGEEISAALVAACERGARIAAQDGAT